MTEILRDFQDELTFRGSLPRRINDGLGKGMQLHRTGSNIPHGGCNSSWQKSKEIVIWYEKMKTGVVLCMCNLY